ncbi:hypothetical protein HMPREF1244_0932 [Streptococcus pyogenes GA19702]|nr:hypothetical protein HMPREF1244_0932 [Streptococcus pyogenes GA19702]
MIISFESVILKHNKIIAPEKRRFMKKTKLIFLLLQYSLQ